MFVIQGQKCKESALQKEWLESNLLGSYIYSNLLCQNTLSEHSLLSIPYQNKMLTLVSSLIEKIHIDNQIYFTNLFQHSRDKIYLEKFYIDNNPNFIYNFNGIKLIKSILLVHDKNITVIKYKFISLDKNISLSLSPLISMKEYNILSQDSTKRKYKIAKEQNYIKFIHSDDINIFFYFDKCQFSRNKITIHDNNPVKEKTYLLPCEFSFQLTPENNECYFVISSERIKEMDIPVIFNNEITRRISLSDKLMIKNELSRDIILSAAFYIKNENNIYFLKNSLLNSYVSFSQLINSLNILFTLKKFNDIKDLLIFLINDFEQGPIKYLNTSSEKNIYGSIDNSFWYLLNIFKYIEYTGDWKFIKDKLWKKIKLILYNFINNYIPNIKIDYDGLLLLNSTSNYKIDPDQIIEYKEGKHIVLNILWYNSVRIIELLAAKFADIEYHTRAEELAHTIKKYFYPKFWNKEKDYFNYRIEIPSDQQIDDSLRPYQIFTISLPFEDLINHDTKQKILDLIENKLLTPFGLKTLSSESKNFISNYDPEKSESFNNGIIHPYLLFHYLTAFLKINKYSNQAKKRVKALLSEFEKKLTTNIIGFFPQFFNSEPPFESAGLLDYSITMSEYLKIRSEELEYL